MGQSLRACLKIAWGAAARDFGCGQGGEVGASPQRAVTTEPTPATGKRPAARRVFEGKASGFVAPQSKFHEGYSPSSRLALRLSFENSAPRNFKTGSGPIRSSTRFGRSD